MSYIKTILNNPLSKIPTYYTLLTPQQQLYILSTLLNPSLLLLHRITILLPQDVIKYILSFLFNNKNNIDLYWSIYTLLDSITQYQYVLHTNIENSFTLNPEEYSLIRNNKNATYITFENYEQIVNLNEEYKEILDDNLQILPPMRYLYKRVTTVVLIMLLFLGIMVAVVCGLYYVKNTIVNAVFVILFLIIIIVLVIGIWSTFDKINNKTYSIKNIPINV